ncbi:MAG: chromate transporter [Dehalobacterium sp.]
MIQEKILEKPTRAMNLWWDLFLTFFKIGAATIGGGYAMVPFIEKAIVDKKKWIEAEQFLDMLAIAQSAPGALAVNTAVSVGYQIAGTPGALFATFGATLPSFIIIIVIAIFLLSFQGNRYVEGFFLGAAPAVTMLLFIAAFSIGKKAIKDRAGIFLLVVGLIAVIWLGIHPILAILAAGIFGAFYYR